MRGFFALSLSLGAGQIAAGLRRRKEAVQAGVSQCQDGKFGLPFCSEWCNNLWGCGTPKLSAQDSRNTDNVDYVCDCAGCNGCPGGSSGTRRRRRRRRDGDPSPSPPVSSPSPSPSPVPPLPPSQGQCQEFLFLGDQGFGNSKQKSVAAGLAKVAADLNPTAIFSMGDNLYGGTSHDRMVSRWRNIYPDKYASLRRPWYGMAGNHDWNNGDARDEVSFAKSSKNTGGYWNMPDIYYTLPMKLADGTTIDFIVFDSHLYSGARSATKHVSQSKQEAWLDSALGNSTADWKIVLGHHPVYYWNKDSESVSKRSYGGIIKPLKKHNVPLLFAGHRHHAELATADGIYCVTSGGGAGGEQKSFIPPQNGMLAYYNGGTFVSAKICNKQEAEIAIYNWKGERRWQGSVPNNKNRRSAKQSSEEPDVEVESDVFSPYEPADKAAECNGAKLMDVDRVCSKDRCTVTVEAPWSETCSTYCSRHGLECKGGWSQDHEEDCTILDDLGCEGTMEVPDNHMCQCG